MSLLSLEQTVYWTLLVFNFIFFFNFFHSNQMLNTAILSK